MNFEVHTGRGGYEFVPNDYGDAGIWVIIESPAQSP